MKNLKKAGGMHSVMYTLKKSIQFGFFTLWKSMISKNTCKGCAIGMGGQEGGLRNELCRFPEFCKKSIQAMSSDLRKGIDDSFFVENSIEALKSLSSFQLEKSGRLKTPLYRSPGSTHYKPISWEEAFKLISEKLSKTSPQKSFFYGSGRSSNEAGFLLQIMARQFGTNNISNCAYLCHQASGVGMMPMIGSGTATVKLEDVENADLIILIGGNPSSNHPRLLSSVRRMKQKGGKVIVINPVKEPGLIRFKIPSYWKSLLFGTKIADLYVQPNIGGDISLLLGVAKILSVNDAIDRSYIDKATKGWETFEKQIEKTTWAEIEQNSGISRVIIEEIALLYSKSNSAIFSWTLGITQHLHGTQNVQMIANLALMRGMIGKPGAGLLPLRGHSNIQGIGTVGVTPGLKKNVFENLAKIGIKTSSAKGYDPMTTIESASRNEMEFGLCLGGNLYSSVPDAGFAEKAIKNVGMLVYLNTTLNLGHIFGIGLETIVLPVKARDEESQPTTQESMFNYIRLSDGGKERIPSAKSEIEVISTISAKVFGLNSKIKWNEMKNYHNIRQLIACTIPGMEKLSTIDNTKEEFTIPNRVFHTPHFNTPDHKANFMTFEIPKLPDLGVMELRLMSCRSEGQFNTVVYEQEDAFRKMKHRQVILMNPLDIENQGLKAGQIVKIESATGFLNNIEVVPFDIKQRNAMMYYPEANVIISRDTDPQTKTPAYKSTVINIKK